jgi:hypothetical protein
MQDTDTLQTLDAVTEEQLSVIIRTRPAQTYGEFSVRAPRSTTIY